MTYLCPSCNYPAISAADHCDNPACLENPAITAAQRERIKTDTAKLQREQEEFDRRMARAASLRAAGFITAF